ncbi:MAG: L-serine ammonia-lyase, iron-sulfur-dependent, subunit alpha [Peptoniphilaceae bacterium]|nr:L-serine ammonia-lyase, iron-sulfur-dependent, subunit alpha [Peptoniphilaceae bacterium]MDY5842198.1 L-serine ammonia-lyase, iron-sulfur-dependent, subunit alpha [Peptoniphilaceae bacterium]
MTLTREEMQNYTDIINGTLIPAMGCTEPIAIAYAAAKARSLLPEEPMHISLACSGNIIKNVKSVTVPNSGGQRGISAAAILGMVGGEPDKMLEVISNVNEEDREKCRELVKQGFCDVCHVENVLNLYIQVKLWGRNHEVKLTIEDHHTNITQIQLDGKIIYQKEKEAETTSMPARPGSSMSLRGILEYADTVDIADIRDVLQRQIDMNSAISQEGLDEPWGAQVGKTVLENWGSDVRSRAVARAAAGSDARMSGCALPVVINSGSGNQGITVTMPVLEYAGELQISEQKRFRALAVSNLVSIYIKHFIGALSAFCGAVSAACGAGAAITYMSGGSYQHIGRTITNTLGNVGGIVCDGAKPSCAAKIASSVNAAILGHYMSMAHKEFLPGEGIVEEDVEATIRNMGYIGKVGMQPTDSEILKVMTDHVDVNSCW